MAKTYTEKDLKGMAVNPTVKGRVVESYPQLYAVLRDFTIFEGDEDKMLRYTFWLYDPASPLQIEYRDIKKRKLAAEELTGFGHAAENASVIVAMLCHVIKSEDWMVIATHERWLYEITEIMNDKITGATDEEILKACDKKIKLAQEQVRVAGLVKDMKASFFESNKELETAAPSRTSEYYAHRVDKK